MTDVIYESPRVDDHPPSWRITKQANDCTNTAMVRFHRVNRFRTLLNQTAAWTPNGWDDRHWIPTIYKVPRHLLDMVEQHMQQQQP
jgi:hypothetical protein